VAKQQPNTAYLIVVTPEGGRIKVSMSQVPSFKWVKGMKVALADEVSDRVLKDAVLKRVGNELQLESSELTQPVSLGRQASLLDLTVAESILQL
jgi:hypothetical protein